MTRKNAHFSLIRSSVLAVVFLSCCLPALRAAAEGTGVVPVYIGTYTRGDSEGIYRLSLNLSSGQLTMKGVTPDVVNPSFLAIHPSGEYLYAVNEVGELRGKKTGGVSAFAIRKDGSLKFLNQKLSGGGDPCHIVVDRRGKFLLVANYTGGSVASLAITDNGQLGRTAAFIQHRGSSVNPQRQEGPHAHSINLDAANRFAVAADLGLDKMLVYRFDASSGQLTPHEPAFAKVAAGAGPRHFAFHPSQKFAYVINELACSVTVFAFDQNKGSLATRQTIPTVDKVRTGYSTAEVQVHPGGKFLYGSNRGHDSIAVYAIDVSTGRLKHVETEPTKGRTPRNFGIDPTGKFLLAANQSTNSVVVFRIDQQSGALSPTGHELRVPTPVCVKFLPVR